MAGNTPFQVGNGDPEGVVIPGPIKLFSTASGTPVAQPAAITNVTLGVLGVWTTANVVSVQTTLSQVIGALKSVGVTA